MKHWKNHRGQDEKTQESEKYFKDEEWTKKDFHIIIVILNTDHVPFFLKLKEKWKSIFQNEMIKLGTFKFNIKKTIFRKWCKYDIVNLFYFLSLLDESSPYNNNWIFHMSQYRVY